MSIRVSSLFPASEDAPFCLARHFIGTVLPGDFMWEISFSVRECQFCCYTKVPSVLHKRVERTDDSNDLVPWHLGIQLRFKITKDCELYASELLPSQTHTDKKANGDIYKKLKLELIPKFTKSWAKELKGNGVNVKF